MGERRHISADFISVRRFELLGPEARAKKKEPIPELGTRLCGSA
jgi:hypothetical protein